ncbi:MFS transporter [Rhodococcus sp. 114MFTsu3.1]|uniref:MFS transporter n=1 Tax=Rhodococcus sp. 114MFTsu3.1 TaxID=1172184 RepID=UPI0012DCBE3A|nr:MFS transporter [Rhodococcus sp. 114MFTsu3.1]
MSYRLSAGTNVVSTLVVLTAGLLSVTLLLAMVAPVLPLFTERFGTTQATTSWVMTSYMVSASVATPIVGRLGDRYGKRIFISASLAIVSAGSLVALFADSIGVLIFARAMQGLGGGLIPLTFSVIRERLDARSAKRAFGAAAATMAVGNGMGVMVAGPLVEGLGYEWLFAVPAVCTFVAAVAAIRVVQPSPANHHVGRVRLVPTLLLSAWLTLALIAVSQGPQWGWSSLRLMVLVAMSIVGCVVWCRLELRSMTPLIDLRMMTSRSVGPINFSSVMLALSMYPFVVLIPALLQAPVDTDYGLGASLTDVGVVLAAEAIVSLVTSAIAGVLATRVGWRILFLVGNGLTCVGYLVLSVAHHNIWHITVASAILGAAIGLSFASMTGLTIDAVPNHMTGVASGVNANLRTIGGAAGIAITAAIVSADVEPSGYSSGTAYTISFLLLFAFAGIATVSAAFITDSPETKR